ncbi:30S ribosomal protein S17 [Beijerinckia indica]|uniref:Small ribosomal subunit protein uS17 n=1 Tax=Beijerinckia indica subsp. indica (strain ATCC 9039 / DSM 1715 / NCIMB 8712) TaxID=395963 RepID=RS17_BEII9|nr:30S ribosomal protein S17 [Beijerinckia indica]B2IK71.1 RecName: Full=Small ribosomal subunit protein uS17; AltName: Full=30S ribosomal protein S17 [Beijerinckia indica subsp. indica ATCC 9039]ACB95003.1 ribosomal protein S17 [Beijerinckia indica subsp. indica ATCC 9039]
MPKRILQGVVVSDKQEKTIVVKVERRFTHPLLKKTVRRSKNYHAHDEAGTYKIGDTVSIEETKPISRLKRWIVLETAAKA